MALRDTLLGLMRSRSMLDAAVRAWEHRWQDNYINYHLQGTLALLEPILISCSFNVRVNQPLVYLEGRLAKLAM